MVRRKRVFISYSHEDEELFNEFHDYLAPPGHEDDVDFWTDKRIKPSQDWDHEIQSAIESAAVAVLLVSQKFLRSEYIRKQELPALIQAREENKLHLTCLYLVPSNVDDPRWAIPLPDGRGEIQLTKYQGLNDPKNPVSGLNEHNRKALFTRASRDISNLMLEPSPPPGPQPPQVPRLVQDMPGLLAMVELPGGTFLMGSLRSDDLASDDEHPQHRVTVSDFCMSRFPVTRELYREIIAQPPKEWKDDNDIYCHETDNRTDDCNAPKQIPAPGALPHPYRTRHYCRLIQEG